MSLIKVRQIGFSGTRFGMSDPQKSMLTLRLRNCTGEFHHGDCVGADAEAHEIAKQVGLLTIAHPPRNKALRAFTKADEIRESKSYLERNRDIVDETEILLACPASPHEHGGTWYTINYARTVQKPVHIILPNGKELLPNK